MMRQVSEPYVCYNWQDALVQTFTLRESGRNAIYDITTFTESTQFDYERERERNAITHT